MLGSTLRRLRSATRYLSIVVLTSLLVLTVLDGFKSMKLPKLSAWHTLELAGEFTRQSEIDDFGAYLNLESELFDELQRELIDVYQPQYEQEINRYVPSSIASPERFSRDYNRSYELVPDTTRGAIVLLHGLTDSPYSLHHLGEQFYGLGFHVVALRLPGHGTVPSALTDVDPADWIAAAKLAVEHAGQKLRADQPLYIAGYSTGAAIALDLVADDLLDDALTRVDRLFLFSPAIGVSRIAVLANLHRLYSFLPGMERAQWLSVIPEFDPFKYQSFSKNSAWHVRRLTRQVDAKLAKLFSQGKTTDLPSVFVAMSVVDATVLEQSVVDQLFRRLPENRHELLLFDINHAHRREGYMRPEIEHRLESLLSATDVGYRRSILSNWYTDTALVEAVRSEPGEAGVVESTSLAWPYNLFSLSHVALTFPESDPLYGAGFREDMLSLGAIDLRREGGILMIPDRQLTRLRYNPFYPYIEQRMAEFVEQDMGVVQSAE